MYNDFSAFSRDQEQLISFNGRNDTNAPDYVEGQLLLNQPSQALSFYPGSDQPRITSLITQFGIIYIIELVKYYDDSSEDHIDQVINLIMLFSFLKFGSIFFMIIVYWKDLTYMFYCGFLGFIVN